MPGSRRCSVKVFYYYYYYYYRLFTISATREAHYYDYYGFIIILLLPLFQCFCLRLPCCKNQKLKFISKILGMAEDKFKESLRKILRDLASEETCCDCCRPAEHKCKLPWLQLASQNRSCPSPGHLPQHWPTDVSERALLPLAVPLGKSD